MELTEVRIEGYERVVRAVDKQAGLTAFVAIHDTTLGPALGGCRMWPFPDHKSALEDVLRLAEGMTYKSAMAETGMGGGKAVLVGDPNKDKSEALFLAFGDLVERLEGRYVTAEDVGTSVEDMKIIRRRTRHVTGLPREQGSSGDPSPFTALGVFLGISVTAARALSGGKIVGDTPTRVTIKDGSNLAGLRVAVQGLGHVGRAVAEHLLNAGAELVVSDLSADKLGGFLAAHPEVRSVGHNEIYDVQADIFSPNALGGVLNENTIRRLKVRAVAGAANNQLLADADGERLLERGILYAPDFVINAGGVINIACEMAPGGYQEAESLRRVHAIPRALEHVFDLARERNWPTHRAAVAAARARLDAARGK